MRISPIPVASGQKRQTIRGPREGRGQARMCDRLQLYTGQRIRRCRKLMIPDPVCVAAVLVIIQCNGLIYDCHGHGRPDLFARNDGFKDLQPMADWFETRHCLPSEGTLIMWDDYTMVRAFLVGMTV